MSHERKQVLRLLADGKITAEEAERLLEKLERAGGQAAGGGDGLGQVPAGDAPDVPGGDPFESASGSASGSVPGSASGSASGRSYDPAPGEQTPPGRAESPRMPKFLRVVVDSSDGDKVNIRVPISLIRTGIKLSTVLPEHANDRLRSRGIDLSELAGKHGEELVEALRALHIEVDSSDGERVRVFCE